ncbi:hypothetical protein BDK51DRAFT_46018 [Blyttiomyces helicus]|uniref:Mitochondrial carrier domain-containing protein n=1 Tax=Blyttiomyces helicus TaxID=388810 RepID=A0A4P9WG38_9FUNG|nr:hypothetical protein BDK51DRAFT_46018 [Blyttiomyces helicus]|eukprot:RKO89990.1 hypothetical protein BDK51DRAFT_46018 [Blyttiomyces helicus]
MSAAFFAKDVLCLASLTSAYLGLQRALPPDQLNAATKSVLSGATGGAVLAAISQQLNHRHFPETTAELGKNLPGSGPRIVFKSATGYGGFFAVFDGLRKGVWKARGNLAERTGVPLPARRVLDPTWQATNVLAGGVGGLCYRAATLPFFSGPLDNPLTTKGGLLLLSRTVVGMGVLGFVLANTEALLQEWRGEDKE